MIRAVCFIVLSLVLLPGFISAQDNRYMKLGPFPNEKTAMARARHISHAAGVEVWVLPRADKGGPCHLLIEALPNEENRARLASQLRQLGLNEPEPFEWEGDIRELASVFSVVDETSSPMLPDDVSMVSGYFVVVASFKEKPVAEARRAALAMEFGQARVLDARVDGQRYYRVAVGPASGGTLAELRHAIAEAGIRNSWLLPHTGSNIESPVTRRDTAALQETESADHGPAENGYNPAKLRKGPNPFFEAP